MAPTLQKLERVILALLVLRFVRSDSDCTPCPDEADLDGACVCTSVEYASCNAIAVSSPTLHTCIDALVAHTPGGFYAVLEVNGADSVEVDLTDNFLQGLLFEQVLIDNTQVLGIHQQFLGPSRDVTQILQFGFCQLNEIPVIDGPNVTHLTIKEEGGYLADISLSSTQFELLPQLQMLRLYLDEATVTVGYHAFFGLTHLREIEFQDCHAVLDFGSMSFNSKYLEQVKITKARTSRNQERKCDADNVDSVECCGESDVGLEFCALKFKVEETPSISATAGSLNGFPPGSSLIISTYNGVWTPEVFFNILSLGGYISVTEPHDCCEDLRWVRYSDFVRQFSITCWGSDGTGVSLADVDLDFSGCSSGAS